MGVKKDRLILFGKSKDKKDVFKTYNQIDIILDTNRSDSFNKVRMAAINEAEILIFDDGMKKKTKRNYN